MACKGAKDEGIIVREGVFSPSGLVFCPEEEEMHDFSWSLLTRLGPKQMQEIGRRALLLERIDAREPIGRRAVATEAGMSERDVRAAAEALREQGFIKLTASGMTLTRAGRSVMPDVRSLCRMVTDLGDLEQQMIDCLGLDRVIVVPGNADERPETLKDIGRAAAGRLKQLLMPDMVIAVAGGSTMSQVAKAMTPGVPNVMVVPARGGIGLAAATQADTVAGDLAHHMGADCRLMHLPDGVTTIAMNELVKLPTVREALEYLRRADIIIFGIGRADTMARRRGLEAPQLETLLKLGAVGESLGDFFDLQGRLVYRSPSVSAELKTNRPGSRMIAAAGGGSKAEAILAAVRHNPPNSLIIDEGAARGILNILPQTTRNNIRTRK